MARHDLALEVLVLVPDGQTAEPVVDAHGDAHRPHVVEGVHGGDEPERRLGRDGPDPRDGQAALPDGREERVKGVLGAAVELFDVEEATLAHGGGERSVDEVLVLIALAQDALGRVMADELGGREVGVPLDEHERDAPFGGDGPEHGGLARARWALEQQVPPGGHGGPQELELPGAPDHSLRRRHRAGGAGGCHSTSGWIAPVDQHPVSPIAVMSSR